MDNTSQQLLQVAGGAGGEKTYVEDVFSTYLWKGNATARSINNGIDLSGEGGMTWIKQRNGTRGYIVNDTARGAGNRLGSNDYSASASGSAWLSAFNSDGFSIGNDGDVNENNYNFSSWSFRKTPGFFDVVTYTGDGASSRNISHSLGSVPGMILIKRTNGTANWAVYHRSTTASKYLSLNTTDGSNNGSEWFANGTEPTASVFSVGNQGVVNGNSDTYVAYLFAGGDSDAATARSVEFDGSGDYLSLAASFDWEFTGEFCIEYWVKPDVTNQEFPTITWGDGAYRALFWNGSSAWRFQWPAGSSNVTMGGECHRGQWQHHALTRDSSNNLRFFINGTLIHTSTQTGTLGDNATLYMGYKANVPSNELEGKLSNVRIVKGSAVYTSPFRPPTEPLGSITNTVLLCCNNSSTTGKTTGGTITANGDPTASTDSPFDDPEGYKFGEDENIIKCGSYTGNQAANVEVDCGWEPQWILFKNASSSANWILFDTMRGISTDGIDNYLYPNLTNAEYTEADRIELTSTGFTVLNAISWSSLNTTGDKYVYVAIRRPDGYVGKPAEAGTDVFAMDTGNATASTNPAFDSGFPVDFGFLRSPASSSQWLLGARLMQKKYLRIDANDAQANAGHFTNDSNEGWKDYSNGTGEQAWMWKRGKGFDVVAFKGTGAAHLIPHMMNTIPEFIIFKNRETNGNQWYIYNKGLNGGTNPEDYYVKLGGSGNAAEAGDSGGNLFNSIAPTSLTFSVGTSSAINESGKGSIAMLFASVAGISKCGFYDGSASPQTITTGFSPRLVIIKRTSSTRSWVMIDTLRGENEILYPNETQSQEEYDWLDLISTGFTLAGGVADTNNAGDKYIYYAHA